MKKIILTLILVITYFTGWCDDFDFEVDGLQYRITNLKNPSTVKIVGVNPTAVTVVIPDEVQYKSATFTIEEELPVALFMGNETVEKVDITRKITSLPMWFFYECSNLKEVTGIKDVESIGAVCFYGCYQLSFPTFNKLKKVEVRAFANTGITDLSIFPNISIIEDGGFMDCMRLRVIPPMMYVQSLGAKAFWGCNSIKEMTTFPSLVQMGDSAFNFKKLSVMPSFPKLKSITGKVFANLGLTQFPDLPALEYAGFSAFEGNDFEHVELPKVKTLGESTFKNCKKLITVSLPKVSRIDRDAFKNCSELAVIEIPLASSISESCFENCKSLREINTTNSLREIGNNAFKNCNNLVSFPYSSNLTKIGDNAFENAGLTQINLNGTLKTIGKEAFKNVTKVESITVPGSVTYLGLNCFRGMTGVKTLIFEPGTALNGADVEYWDEEPWWDLSSITCMSLEKVEIRRKIEWAGFTPLTENQYFDYLPLPKYESYKYHPKYPDLKEVVISDIASSYPAPFMGTDTHVIMDCDAEYPPEKQLEPYHLSDLEWRTNPRIGLYKSFFQDAKEVTFGENVKLVWAECFSGLEKITCKAKTPPKFIKDEIFSNRIYINATLYVPNSSIDVYKKTQGWSDFFDIQPIDPTGESGINELPADTPGYDGEYFDLTGRKVSAPEKGIYILKDSRGVRKVIF